MDHAEARELVEIGAVERGGLARFIAGDTPEAAALAGHLAGCPDCAAEMERLRRSAAVIRDAVRLMPPPELRERTLAMVAALGRPRGQETAVMAGQAAPAIPAPEPVDLGAVRGARFGRAPRPAMWLATLAAAIVIAVVGTSVFVGGSRDRQIEELREVAAWTIRVDRQADVRHVALTAAAGGAGPDRKPIFSPSLNHVVVVSTQPAPPGARHGDT